MTLNSDLKPNKREIRQNLFHQCDCFFHLLETEEFEKIDKMYNERLYKLNTETNVHIHDNIECVNIKGVDKLGRICIERDGLEEYFDYGSLKILYPS